MSTAEKHTSSSTPASFVPNLDPEPQKLLQVQVFHRPGRGGSLSVSVWDEDLWQQTLDNVTNEILLLVINLNFNQRG